MSAITIIKFDKGIQSVERGTLIDCPAELLTPGQMSFYLNTSAGWSRCPNRYWVYAAFDAMGRKLVIPGVSPSDEKREKKKFGDFGLTFTKAQIQGFLEPHLKTSETIREERDSEFRNLTHDLRAIGAEIYSTALAARQQAEYKEQQLVQPLDSVLAAQQMLSVRLDVVDYESGFAASRPPVKIPVYKKVEKVIKCFQSNFQKKRITPKIQGSNFARTYGPPIFELIPFVIIENAVKYSPVGGSIDVHFSENSGVVTVEFISMGPRLSDNEQRRIFEKNFRGDAARELQSGGSGIGLFGAKTLLETHYEGQISVRQENIAKWIDGKNFYKTNFEIKVPIADHDTPRYRRKRIRRNKR